MPRQQTLEASVEWSHDLLDDDERRVLRRLSIFAGSFDIDAAERVVAFDGVDTVTVFDTVSRLVDKSLVQVDERTTGQLRYSLLDTLRAYGRDRLAEASEAELTRDRHLLFIRGLAESAVPGLTRAESGVLDRLDDHLDDIRVALDWACSQPGRDGDALAIVGALAFWWSLRGRAREGQSWCERALDAAPPDASAPRLWARWARAHVAYYGGDVLTALNEAASLAADAAEAGDATLESRALTLSGGTFEFMDPAGARAALDRAVEQAEAGGDEWTIADAHQLRAFSHLFQGGWEPMERDFAQARPTAERWDHAYLLGWDLVGRAWRALATGVLREAEMTAREGQRVARRLGVGSVDGCATLLLVTALTERGLTDDALTLAREGKAHLARHAGIFADELVAIAQGRTHLARGELPDAIAQLGAGLTALRSVGVNVLCDQASAWLAAAHRGTGDLASARRHAEEGLELARLIGDALGEAESSLELARVAAAEGQRKTAEESCHVALVKAVEADARPLIVRALEELASQAVTAEAAVEAARLLGAARRARTAMGLVPYADEQVALEATTGAIAEALDDLDWAAALEEGAALDLGDAVAYARRARGERGRPSHGWESLTPTQLKVVELVAQGLTNPQIGERLFVGRGTVKTHLAAIFAKLGVATRAELAAAASRRGLGEAGR